MALDTSTLNGETVYLDSKTDSATNETVVITYDENFEIIGSETKDASGNTVYKSTITADTDGFSAAADVAANADLTLGGTKAADGKITNTVAEKVSITSVGNDSGMKFKVTGTNAAGEAVTEEVTGANAGSATSTNEFLTITKIEAVGDPAGKVSVAGEGLLNAKESCTVDFKVASKVAPKNVILLLAIKLSVLAVMFESAPPPTKYCTVTVVLDGAIP